jgi:hypothetical protein
LGIALAALSSATAGTTMMAPETTVVPPVTPTVSDDLGFTLSVGYDTDYIFRGTDFGQHLVWSALDYSHEFEGGLGLDLGAWFAALADDDYTELDLYGSLSYSFGPVDVSAGYIHYFYFRDDSDAPEVFGTVGTEVLGVGLELYAGYDFEVEGTYLALTAGYAWDLTDRIGLDFSAGVSYSFEYYTLEDDWNAVDVRLGIPFALSDRATLEPYAAVSLPLDALDEIGQEDTFYGGVSLSVTF